MQRHNHHIQQSCVPSAAVARHVNSHFEMEAIIRSSRESIAGWPSQKFIKEYSLCNLLAAAQGSSHAK